MVNNRRGKLYYQPGEIEKAIEYLKNWIYNIYDFDKIIKDNRINPIKKGKIQNGED